jgi:hypothetical protein
MSMHPPPDPDELASDLVDGRLPADEAARLRSDPAIAARVAAIEAARDALRVTPPSAPGAVDRALAAAFAALDRDDALGEPSDERPPPPVTDLRSVGGPGTSGAPVGPRHFPAATGTPSRWRSSGGTWLAAAAVIVLLGLVTIGILSSSSSNDHASDEVSAGNSEMSANDQAGGAAERTDSAGEGTTDEEGAQSDANVVPPGDSAPSDSQAATTVPTPDSPSSPSSRSADDLGSVTSASELAERVRAAVQGPAGAVTDDDGSDVLSSLPGDGAGSTGCAGLTLAGDPARGEAVYVADATFNGRPVRAHLYDLGNGEQRLVATDRSCTDVVDVPYTP